MDGPLPPLTDEEKGDRLLQPLPPIPPPDKWTSDGWTIVTDTGESYDHHSVQGLVKWAMQDGRLQSVERLTILRHRKDQIK